MLVLQERTTTQAMYRMAYILYIDDVIYAEFFGAGTSVYIASYSLSNSDDRSSVMCNYARHISNPRYWFSHPFIVVIGVLSISLFLSHFSLWRCIWLLCMPPSFGIKHPFARIYTFERVYRIYFILRQNLIAKTVSRSNYSIGEIIFKFDCINASIYVPCTIHRWCYPLVIGSPLHTCNPSLPVALSINDHSCVDFGVLRCVLVHTIFICGVYIDSNKMNL